MADPKDRRRYHRRSASVPVEVVVENRRYNGLIINSSRGGAFILTGELLPVGVEISVVYPFSGIRKKKKKGMVVRVEKEGIGVKFHRPDLF